MIVVDSGPLIAAAIEDDRDHRRCRYVRGLHMSSEKLLVPQTVLAESAYIIQKQERARNCFSYSRSPRATSPSSSSYQRT